MRRSMPETEEDEQDQNWTQLELFDTIEVTTMKEKNV